MSTSERNIDPLEFPISISEIEGRFFDIGARSHWITITKNNKRKVTKNIPYIPYGQHPAEYIPEGAVLSRTIDPNGYIYHQKVHTHDNEPIDIKNGIPYKWESISKVKLEKMQLMIV